MAGMSKQPGVKDGASECAKERVEEGVTVVPASPSQLRDLVGGLEDPWIADEGATDCGLRRGLAELGLRQRGMAFDSKKTIVWDEDEVQVITVTAPQPGVIPLTSTVLVREGLAAGTGFPTRLRRIDYLREGALIASRYTCSESGSLERGSQERGGPDHA